MDTLKEMKAREQVPRSYTAAWMGIELGPQLN